MRYQTAWKATKFYLPSNGALLVSREEAEVYPGSVLITTLVGRWYEEHLPRYVRGTLLDLGCGKVPLYGLYHRLAERVICTDWLQSLHGSKHIDFASDLNTAIPLADSCIDTVIASDVLEHIYRPHHLLREITRVLKPGGTALLNVPFMYWIHEAPFDFYRYTPHAIERASRSAGLRPKVLDSIGSGTYVVVDVLSKMLATRGRLGRKAARVVQSALLRTSKTAPNATAFPLVIAAVLCKELSDARVEDLGKR